MTQSVKAVFIASSMFISMGLGCNNTKKVAENTTEDVVGEESLGSDQVEFTFGKVTTAHAADGCPYLIMLKTPLEDGKQFLLPIGMDEEYLQDGLSLKFVWGVSRASSGNCYTGQPAILSNIRTM